MNIECKAGHKVMVTKDSSTNGYKYDAEEVAKYLKIGIPYTVANITIDRSRTEVELEEVPGVTFNSVNLEDYDENYVEPDTWDVEMCVSTNVSVTMRARSEEEAIERAKKFVDEFPMCLDLSSLEVNEITFVNKRK